MGVRLDGAWLSERLEQLALALGGVHLAVKARDNATLNVEARDLVAAARAIVRATEERDLFDE